LTTVAGVRVDGETTAVKAWASLRPATLLTAVARWKSSMLSNIALSDPCPIGQERATGFTSVMPTA
jgi:hypothetical protein